MISKEILMKISQKTTKQLENEIVFFQTNLSICEIFLVGLLLQNGNDVLSALQISSRNELTSRNFKAEKSCQLNWQVSRISIFRDFRNIFWNHKTILNYLNKLIREISMEINDFWWKSIKFIENTSTFKFINIKLFILPIISTFILNSTIVLNKIIFCLQTKTYEKQYIFQYA